MVQWKGFLCGVLLTLVTCSLFIPDAQYIGGRERWKGEERAATTRSNSTTGSAAPPKAAKEPKAKAVKDGADRGKVSTKGAVPAGDAKDGAAAPEHDSSSHEHLSRLWREKYNKTFTSKTAKGSASPKPVVWVLCTGHLTAENAKSFAHARGSSYAVSLNRFLYIDSYLKSGMVPTHHWLVEEEMVDSGVCLKHWQRTKKIAPSVHCELPVKVARKAREWQVKLIAKDSVILYLRAVSSEAELRQLYTEKEWLAKHPLPITLNALTLGHGIRIALSLAPLGATIKLLGCDGQPTGGQYDPKQHHKDLKAVSEKLQDKVLALRTLGPGWDVVNCNPESNYVRLGAMPGTTKCFDKSRP